MIWKFDNSNTYLLGSIHALKAGDHPWSNKINDIYLQSEHILVETDINSVPLSLLTYNDGSKLNDKIPHKLFIKTQKQWTKYGLPENELEKTKPWQVANRLTFAILGKKGFTFDNGIDKQIVNRARADNKDIIFLESSDTSLLCFENAPQKEQEEYLRSVVENPDAVINRFNAILKAWSLGDIITLSNVLQECFKLLPLLFQCLIINRNEAWLRTILTSIESGTPSLIAVGALHLVDVCGIPSRSREVHGYTSTQIK